MPFQQILDKPIFNLVRVLYVSFVYDVSRTSVDNKFTLMRWKIDFLDDEVKL